jgi:hypothetical protein
MAGKVVGQVAVELEQEAEEAVAYLAFGKRARGCCLIVYPTLELLSVNLFLALESGHTGAPPMWEIASPVASLVA